ncbi:hypothetical protein CYMTET_50646 [Cymbomonas tetramitiformis]|uniref:Transmembrane protein n=1 Tax=Cymbomonas tetramitiformis TaxID=36881 RepID=A0AAE0BP00_9CHLO|nr:hypothetical protein CYMTET_50646 [Cymbomonas tetramitiformis]
MYPQHSADSTTQPNLASRFGGWFAGTAARNQVAAHRMPNLGSLTPTPIGQGQNAYHPPEEVPFDQRYTQQLQKWGGFSLDRKVVFTMPPQPYAAQGRKWMTVSFSLVLLMAVVSVIVFVPDKGGRDALGALQQARPGVHTATSASSLIRRYQTVLLVVQVFIQDGTSLCPGLLC